MSSLATLPSRYASVPSLQKMQDRMHSLTGRNRELNKQARGSVNSLEAVGLTQLGAALSGVGVARGWDQGTMGIAGGALAAFGIAFSQPSAVMVANGILAPIVALTAAGWYSNSRFGGNAGNGV